MFGQDRDSLRAVFFTAWAKHKQGQPLEPLEQQIVTLLKEHPEYHRVVAEPRSEHDRDYPADVSNPFLHLGLHLAVRDQLALDRPLGVRRALTALKAATGLAHEAEHLAMEELSQILWAAQRSGTAPDEHRYLQQLEQRAQRLGQAL